MSTTSATDIYLTPTDTAAKPWMRSRTRVFVEWLLLTLAIANCAHTVLPQGWERINTDFPNYYVSARLIREGCATQRIYEWEWFARQKERMAVDQPLAGFIPHTPFSALVLAPFSGFAPLTAKRVWILANLGMLALVIALLATITELPWRWLAIAALLSVPVYRNLEYGQMYLLVLLLLVAALWLYIHGHRAASGVLIAIATGLKIFPVLFVLYFARKRDIRALIGFMAGSAVVGAACIAVFDHRLLATFATQILPAALRGEANDPYNLSASSISSLIHHLFVYEPQLNQHPLLHAPIAMAVIQPLLQLLVWAPVLLLCAPGDDRQRVLLEWGAMVVAILAASTMPASYHFVLLLLPLAIWASHHARMRQRLQLAAFIGLYFLICWPRWPGVAANGWMAVLAVPRLWAVLILLFLCCRGMRQQRSMVKATDMRWIAAVTVLCTIQVVSMLYHVDGLYDGQGRQVASAKEVFSAGSPSSDGNGITFIAMTLQGWRLGHIDDPQKVHVDQSDVDVLGHAQNSDDAYLEYVAKESSIWLRRSPTEERMVVADAESPIISRDGSSLSFIRALAGRASLWTRQLETGLQHQITPSDLDVYEASFDQNGDLVFAAMNKDAQGLFRAERDGRIQPLGISDARYPSVSPDGKWLAYTKLSHGAWHLTVRDLATNRDLTLNAANCNQFSPAWRQDSKTLVYASDCGRGLWETALYVQRVVP